MTAFGSTWHHVCRIEPSCCPSWSNLATGKRLMTLTGRRAPAAAPREAVIPRQWQKLRLVAVPNWLVLGDFPSMVWYQLFACCGWDGSSLHEICGRAWFVQMGHLWFIWFVFWFFFVYSQDNTSSNKALASVIEAIGELIRKRTWALSNC